jgi:hypothetical protein
MLSPARPEGHGLWRRQGQGGAGRAVKRCGQTWAISPLRSDLKINHSERAIGITHVGKRRWRTKIRRGPRVYRIALRMYKDARQTIAHACRTRRCGSRWRSSGGARRAHRCARPLLSRARPAPPPLDGERRERRLLSRHPERRRRCGGACSGCWPTWRPTTPAAPSWSGALPTRTPGAGSRPPLRPRTGDRNRTGARARAGRPRRARPRCGLARPDRLCGGAATAHAVAAPAQGAAAAVKACGAQV